MATAKPMKKGGRSRSPFRKKWAATAVKNGATDTMIPTLDASVIVSAIFSNRKYKVTPHNPAPANSSSSQRREVFTKRG
ncbi:hypothetical protein D3C75_808620 [compost metagenome]